jgi:hypothetical protein
MNYEDIARDFVARTLSNLNAVDGLPPNDQTPFYEVTHLVNSLLGLIVVPNEQMQDSLPATTLDELQASGWDLNVVWGSQQGPADLRKLISGLRNAVAHFRLQFHPDSNGVPQEIKSVTLWSMNAGGTDRYWGVRFTVPGLHSFVERLAKLLLEPCRLPESTT